MSVLVEQYDFNDRWRLDLGTRSTSWSTSRTPTAPSWPAASRRSAFPVACCGEFADGYNAGLTLSRNQRAPQIEELYPNGAHPATATFDVGDESLKTETANNIDVTFRKIAGAWQWSGTAYYTYFNDFIYGSFVPVPTDAPYG